MANRGPNTNGSRFFISTADTPNEGLDGKHVVFGALTAGKDVLTKMAAQASQKGAPRKPVTIVNCGQVCFYPLLHISFYRELRGFVVRTANH